MALFTTADRDSIRDAIVRLAVDGITTVTVAGETVTTKSLDELRRLLELVQQDLASTATTGGMRIRQLVPGGCG